MLTSRRMLSLLLAAAAVIAILSGCYAAPVSETTEQGGETSGAIVTDSEIPVTTYPVPEENIRVFGNMAASASTGGFWQWDTFFRPYIQAYDPVTRTTYVPCYQNGCRHNDPTCNACFGDLQSLVEYRGNYYALVFTDNGTASALVTRPLSGGPLQTLASWEPENENESCRCVLRCVSFGKAYVISNRETYELTEGVQLTAAAQESSLVSVDLQTGEISTILENCDNYDLYGVWEDIAVLRVLEMAEDAPEFEDWLAQQPEGTAWDEYDRQFVRYRFLTRNLQTGEESVLVDTSENFVMTVDPHRSWGQYAVYQVDRSLYVYDLEEQAKRKLFTYERDWGFYNYQIMDGHVIAICGTEDTCRAWAVDIADGSVIALDTRGGNVVAFGANYECNGYFAGLKRNSSGDFEQCYISKEDFYRSNYDAAFR
ncbi:MAG: hypothetical protein ACLS83_02540 [Oscillospiraceae bacterium]